MSQREAPFLRPMRWPPPGWVGPHFRCEGNPQRDIHLRNDLHKPVGQPVLRQGSAQDPRVEAHQQLVCSVGYAIGQPGAKPPPIPSPQWKLFVAQSTGTVGIRTGRTAGTLGWAGVPLLSCLATTCSNPCGLTEHGVHCVLQRFKKRMLKGAKDQVQLPWGNQGASLWIERPTQMALIAGIMTCMGLKAGLITSMDKHGFLNLFGAKEGPPGSASASQSGPGRWSTGGGRKQRRRRGEAGQLAVDL